MDVLQLEEAALNAWAAKQQVLFDGWVLRFADGYTKRANSVNGLFPSTRPLPEKVDVCEAVYRSRGLPTIFRLSPLSETGLDPLLESRGYRRLDDSFVMTRRMGQGDVFASGSARQCADPSEWVAIFCGLSGADLERHKTHREILELTPASRTLAVLEIDGAPVACGAGLSVNGCFGLFDIATAANLRRRGFGSRLVSYLMAQAIERGEGLAYLQVMADNAAALRLYQLLGFTIAYSYWYRMK